MNNGNERHVGQIFWCEFCHGPGSTKHHLIPHSLKTYVSPAQRIRETIRLCSRCHTEVHYFFSNSELGYTYNDPALLLKELEARRTRLPPPRSQAKKFMDAVKAWNDRASSFYLTYDI